MRLSELETHFDAFSEIEKELRRSVDESDFPQLISKCVRSFPHILPSIQFEKRRGLERLSLVIMPFDLIIKYAPPLFEHDALLSLLTLIRSNRQLAKHSNNYLQRTERAVENEETARQLWNILEKYPRASQNDMCRSIDASLTTLLETIEIWEEAGIIDRTDSESYLKIVFRLRLEGEMEGICPACGVRGKGRKEAFLKQVLCQKCGAKGYYHMVYKMNS